MKSLAMASILALLLSIDGAVAGSSDVQLATAEPASQSRPMTPIKRQPQIAMVCFYDSQTTSGMNKICYYNCVGSLAAITLGFAEICPMSIDR
jgi:hypothetical protein